ncbi:MAG: DUF3617 family protein [Sphingomicrobium sp.]
MLLVACSEAPKPVEEKAPPAAFPAGQWEVTALTEKLRSADNSTPATKHKIGAAETRKICSPAGPKPSPTLFADQGDDCKLESDYAKNGRINMSMQCKRPGRGQVALTLDGKYDETTFEVVAVTGTYFTGSGDYALTQNIKGKRIGDCPADGAPAAG